MSPILFQIKFSAGSSLNVSPLKNGFIQLAIANRGLPFQTSKMVEVQMSSKGESEDCHFSSDDHVVPPNSFNNVT